MPEITLRFERIPPAEEFDAPVPVSVHFDGSDTETFQFINPLTDKNLAELRWYLEHYWQWPSEIDDQRARAVEGNLPKWGKALADAVFQKSADAMRLLGRFSEAQGQRLLTIDTVEPRILRLPWELLRDEGGYLFSEEISVRRRMHTVKKSQLKPFDLPVRILMVTCRPDGAGFIDPRSIATPLLDALDSLPEQFDVEFLRPPTLKTLDARLRNKSQPPIHIVHFDGHGVYDKGVGLGFLLFEDDKYQMNRVDAEQLGTLLNKSGIPLMVLNACQSAQADERNPFASVASRLIESGVGGVVAMNYSVLVETAKRFTRQFYGALARGGSASAAMDTARRDLFADSKRLTVRRPNEEDAVIVHLQDWFLPALYQQADELIPFSPLSPAVAASLDQKAGRVTVGFPPQPLHGFHGRARELLDLERAFATRRIVVLHGFGGQGKTSLAAQAAHWFTRTHLFTRAAFVSFERGASLEFVLNELGNALVQDNFQIYDGDKVQAIADALQQTPTLLVFDNFESALPGGNAPMSDLQELLGAAAKWFGASESRISNIGSRLLITTRNANIPHPAFTPGQTCLHRELEGLHPSDALELAAVILEAHSLARPARDPLEVLLTFLKGHPLSLELALPQLRHYSATQLVEEYQRILPSIKVGEAKERNESLEVSLRFSLDRLGTEAQTLLSRLRIFEGGAWELALLTITEIPREEWNTLKPQLTSTALIRMEEIPGFQQQPFIHFHPTLVPYLRAISNNANLNSQILNIEEHYWKFYYSLASQLYNQDNQYPIKARAIALHELPNLKNALKLALAAGALDEAVSFAQCIDRFLDYFGRWREKDEIAIEIQKANTKRQKSIDGEITNSEYLLETRRGEMLFQQGHMKEAEKIFRTIKKQLEASTVYKSSYELALTLLRIARCVYSQGQLNAAASLYREISPFLETLKQDLEVRRLIGTIHSDFGSVLMDMGRYDDAENEYKSALNIDRELDDKRGENTDLGQLGRLAIKQKKIAEARTLYMAALKNAQDSGDLNDQALCWYQLSRVAQEEKDWEDVERCCKKSMAFAEMVGDLTMLALIYNQLNSAARFNDRPSDAEQWGKKAIELLDQLDRKPELFAAVLNLAGLLFDQNRIDEAEIYAHRALEIIETLELSAQLEMLYDLLTKIAKKQGHMDVARAWRRKEQEARLIFEANSQTDTSDPDIRKHADQWNDVVAGIIAVCQSGKPEPELDAFLEEMVSKDWKDLVAVLRLILVGERGMDLFDELSDLECAIVRRVLKVLINADGAPQTTERGAGTTVNDQQEGVTLPQLLGLVERAVGGDQQLGGQLFTAFQQMARDDDPVGRALGNVLLQILVGKRDVDLGALPDELASAVRGLLGRLNNGF